MRTSKKRLLARRAKSSHRRWSFERLEDRVLLAGDVVMFNDHIAGPGTHSFTTTYATFGTSSGLLRDSATGATTPILLQTQSNGVQFESVVGTPATGTEAHTMFGGWVDFGSGPGTSISLFGSGTYTHTFSGLNPQLDYEFAGTTSRGGDPTYTNRWTLVTLLGADSFTASHTAGIGIVTDGLAPNQVAIWTGQNHLPDQGFIVEWKDIDPGSDGTIQIISQQYLGLTPGVGTGNASTGSKGYGLTAVRLMELDASFRVASSDPPTGALVTSPPTSYTVNFNRPVNAATVQAADLTVDGLPATAYQVVDEDTVQFTIPAASGNSQHTVAIAGGAISSVAGQSLSAFSATFAILSGSGVVINEISYDSGSDAEPWEYVELFNAGSTPVDLSGWRLANAVSYMIPNQTMLGSGQYLLISQHPAELAARYSVQSLGPFDGRLANDGETLELLNASGVVQDFVDYGLGFPWPTIGDVAGRSIQLVHPALDNGLGGSWRSAPVTPRAANSVFAFNAPPQMRQVSHTPVAPTSGQDVTITMKVTDTDGVDAVLLQYQLVNPGDYIAITDPRYATNWTSVPMRDDGQGGDAVAGDDIYTGVLPGSLQTHRRLVRYRVRATDELGASIIAPYADDPQPNFAYFVYNAIPNWTGAVQPGVTPPVNYSSDLLGSVATYHLITTRQAHEDAQFIPDSTLGGGYTGSDYLWHGALVYDGEVYDHVRFRARGGVWRYAMGKNMWKFDFNRGHDFEARDDYGDEYEVGWSKLNLSAIIQQGDFWHRGEQGLFESVGFKMFNLAGVAASNTNYVHFRIVESANETGADQYSGDFQGLYLAVEQLDDNFLEEHDLPDGNLYKMENGTGVGGIGGESNNQGDYPAVADSSDLIAFKTTYESPPPETAAWWRQNFNLDSYYSYRSIVEAIHHYDIAGGKNYFYYLNPETNQWETLPWDIDLTWANNMFGSGNEPFRSRVLAIAEFALEYRNRIRELRDLLINVEQVGLIVDEMASFVYTPGQPSLVDADRAMWDYNPILVSSYVNPSKANRRFYAGGGGFGPFGDFDGMMQVLKDYAATRSVFIDSTILTDEAQIPNRPTITYTGDAGYPLNQLEFTSSAYSGASPFRAMEWRIGENYHPGTANYVPDTAWKYEVDAVWESGELGTFNSVLDFSGAGLEIGHTYRARVRMQDAAGRWSHWSAPVQFVAAPPIEVPTLAISEVHYNPYNPALADPSDQEFIEIFNYGSEPVNLAGIQIADFRDDPYVFGGGLSLEPGDYIVVARTPAAFTSVYGAGINLAPDGYGTANLSNGGETISLLDAAGALIVSVTYSDTSPWPAAADGTGPSLEVIDAEGDLNAPANWRASQQNGGSPGNNGEQQDLAGDYDNSGAVEQADHAVWRSQFGMSVSPGSGADGNSNGVVDLADFVIWRKNLCAQASSAASEAMSATPAAAATSAPANATTDAARGRLAGPLEFELPLKQPANGSSKFFDGTAKVVGPAQLAAPTELGDLLLRAIAFESSQQAAQYLAQELGSPEHDSGESNWAIDEAFQDLVFDVAPGGESVLSSLDDDTAPA